VRESFFEPIERLWRRPDFRRSPFRALGRRVLWRARWACRSEPWCLRVPSGGTILVPKGGAGALIYYLGNSEPETFQFLVRFLRRGMVFWDVGAHIGEFSLLASQQVGETGKVDAFEPHPRLGDLIYRTIAANRLANVKVHSMAVTDQSGAVQFLLDPEPSTSHIWTSADQANTPVIDVPTVPMDDFHFSCDYSPNLIKVDVEGAEKLVLQGSQSLLQLSPEAAPVWIMEFAPANCVRYHYHPQELLDEFVCHGYRNFWITPSGLADVQPGKAPAKDCLNFVSTKNEVQFQDWFAQPLDTHTTSGNA